MPTINFTKTRKAAYKAINERSIEKNKEIISNLAPTVFAVSKEITQKIFIQVLLMLLTLILILLNV